jgi:hypothetical protein
VTTTKDLLKAGLLSEGDILIWNRRTQGVTHEARVLKDGFLETSDGAKHKTPSGAAKHLNGDKPIDGWLAWKVQKSGLSLSGLRESLIS